jgi:hypothetical protein
MKCNAIACSVRRNNLKYKFNGYFCSHHIKLLSEIRNKIYDYKNTYRELYYRKLEHKLRGSDESHSRLIISLSNKYRKYTTNKEIIQDIWEDKIPTNIKYAPQFVTCGLVFV